MGEDIGDVNSGLVFEHRENNGFLEPLTEGKARPPNCILLVNTTPMEIYKYLETSISLLRYLMSSHHSNSPGP